MLSETESMTTGGFPSGQRGQTVNLMAQPSQVRILHPPFMSAEVVDLLGKLAKRMGVEVSEVAEGFQLRMVP